MSTIGSRIRLRREKLGLTQDELGRRLGYKSRSSINKIELDQRNLTQSKIKAIADALETTPSYIMGWESETTETNVTIEAGRDVKIDNIYQIETTKIPLLGEIACGEPIYANEDRESYVEAGTSIKADFCLKCKGDSMINARIHDGDIVFIRKQSTVNNGEIAVVLIEDEATLKRVFYYQDQSKLILQAENPTFEPLVYIGEEINKIRILGKAVAFQSDVK